MELLCEFILEFVLEGIFGLTLENPNAKTWVNTAIMIFMDLLILGLFAFVAVTGFMGKNWFAFSAGAIFFLGWGIFSIRTTVKGHKRGWK